MPAFTAAAVVWVTGGIVWAQTPSEPPWLTWGVLGLVLMLMVTGHIVPGHVPKQKDQEIDRLVAENAKLRDKVTDDVLPALYESTTVLRDAVEALNRRGAP